MPNLPARVVPVVSSPPSRQERQAIMARRHTENVLLTHELAAHFDREAARIDAETTFEASKAALDSELALLSWGLEKARSAESAAAAKLVSDRVAGLSATNSRNLARRFS